MRFFLAIISLFLFINYNAYGCKCLNELSIKENWENADQVFIGEVIKVDKIKQVYNGSGKQIPLFEIKILESLKKRVLKEFIFRTMVYANSCDFFFEGGKKYLIFAYQYHGGPPFLQAYQCSGTEDLRFVSKNELKELRRLHREFKAEKTEGEIIRENENKKLSILLRENEKLKENKKKLIGLSSILGFLLIVAAAMALKRKNY